MSADYYQVDAMFLGVGDYLLIGGSFQYRSFYLEARAGEFNSDPIQVFLATGESHFYQLACQVQVGTDLPTASSLQLGLP